MSKTVPINLSIPKITPSPTFPGLSSLSSSMLLSLFSAEKKIMIKIDFVLRDISEILICFFTFYILQETVKIIFSLSYNIKHLISNNFNLEFAPDCFTRNQFLSEYFSNSLSRSKLLEVEYSLPATKAPYDIYNFLN